MRRNRRDGRGLYGRNGALKNRKKEVSTMRPRKRPRHVDSIVVRLTANCVLVCVTVLKVLTVTTCGGPKTPTVATTEFEYETTPSVVAIETVLLIVEGAMVIVGLDVEGETAIVLVPLPVPVLGPGVGVMLVEGGAGVPEEPPMTLLLPPLLPPPLPPPPMTAPCAYAKMKPVSG